MGNPFGIGSAIEENKVGLLISGSLLRRGFPEGGVAVCRCRKDGPDIRPADALGKIAMKLGSGQGKTLPTTA